MIIYDSKDLKIRDGDDEEPFDCGLNLNDISHILAQMHFKKISLQKAYNQIAGLFLNKK